MNAPFPPPANYKTYNEKLRATLDEKLFFLTRIPSDVRVFVDFGCAGGALLAELRRRNRTVAVCGYDIDDGQLAVSRNHLSSQCMESEYLLTSKWSAVERFVKTYSQAGHRVCLVLSSVIHEMCKDASEYSALLDLVRKTGVDFVAIRDMALTSSTSEESNQHIQALLKLPYQGTSDFDKECKENYLPLTFEEYLNVSTIGSGFKLRHIDHTPLRWLQNYWVSNCGIHVTDPTHIKMLLQRV